MGKKLSLILDGFVKNNPTFVLVLGMCPTLATTTSAMNGLEMGLATLFVLVLSNIAISLLAPIVPDKVHIPVYIVVIATFVTVLQLLMQAFTPDAYTTLGLFIPLIVVNCIVLGRAEAFANKNTVVDSALDGIGMGLGFTLALAAMGAIREFFGTGCLLGFTIIPNFSIGFFNLPPGGFFVFGVLIAIIQAATKGKALKAKGFSCGLCPMYNSCNTAEANEELEAEKAAKAAPAV